MKNQFWIILAATVAFLGFLLGYSVPPFKEAGLFGGENKVKAGAQLTDDLKDYYKDLYKEEGE